MKAPTMETTMETKAADGHANGNQTAYRTEFKELGMLPELGAKPFGRLGRLPTYDEVSKDVEFARGELEQTGEPSGLFLTSIGTALIHPVPDGSLVQFPGSGKGRTKLFKGIDHGSMTEAKYAAMEWRDVQLGYLSDVVSFAGERVAWSDTEIDMQAERIAHLLVAVEEGALGGVYRTFGLLNFARIAMAQVLPWERWRPLRQARNMPNDLVARVPSMLKRVKAEREEIARKKAAARAAAAASSAWKPSEGQERFVDEIIKRMNGALSAEVERRLKVFSLAIEGLAKEGAKNAERVSACLSRADTVLSQLESKGAALSESDAAALRAQMTEMATMQDLLAEELQLVRRLAGEFEDGKEGVETRLRELEAVVFKLQAQAGNGSNGHAHGAGVKQQEERARVVPVIGIMGPLPDQFGHIQRDVGGGARLVHIENKGGAAVRLPEGLEWVISNRFCSYAQEERARAALPTGRVVHVNTGGISSMVRAVLEVVEQVNGGGAK